MRPSLVSDRIRPRWPSALLAASLHGAVALALLAADLRAPAAELEPPVLVELVQMAPPPPPEPPPVPPQPVAKAVVKAAKAVPTPLPAFAPAVAPSPGPAQPSAAPAAVPAPALEETLLPPVHDAAYLSNPKPAYPSLAQKRGWEGVVVVLVAVDEDGRPQDVAVKASSGYAVLDQCALAAVRQWRFAPARRGSRAVAANVEIPIRFGLGNEADNLLRKVSG